MIIPWNLTRHAAAARQADVIVVSPAKAGRTWLCVMMNKYLSLKYDVPFSVHDLHEHNPAIPSILYSHWIWAHLRLSTFKEWLRGRYIIPNQTLSQKKIILLVRDPRDVIVSAHFHASKRWAQDDRIKISIENFIRHRRFGIKALVGGFNIAYLKLRRHPHHVMIKYEAMKASPARELENVLRLIGETIDPALVREAVAFGEFDNMKRMEQNNQFDHAKLRPGDPSDPHSYKVREGKIGGYVEHFNKTDLLYLDKHLAKLNPEFGYEPAGRTITAT